MFVFEPRFGHDTVTGFGWNDVIAVDRSLFADIAAVRSHAAVDGSGNTVITLDADNSITLEGVTLDAQQYASHFLFV